MTPILAPRLPLPRINRIEMTERELACYYQGIGEYFTEITLYGFILCFVTFTINLTLYFTLK